MCSFLVSESSGKGTDCMGAESFKLKVVTFPLLRGHLTMSLAQVDQVKNPRGVFQFFLPGVTPLPPLDSEKFAF